MFLITSAAHFTSFPVSVPPSQCPLLLPSFSVSAHSAVTQSSAVSPRCRKGTPERCESSSCPGQQTLEHHPCPCPPRVPFGAMPSIWDIKLQKHRFSFIDTIQMWGAAGGSSFPLSLTAQRWECAHSCRKELEWSPALWGMWCSFAKLPLAPAWVFL